MVIYKRQSLPRYLMILQDKQDGPCGRLIYVRHRRHPSYSMGSPLSISTFFFE